MARCIVLFLVTLVCVVHSQTDLSLKVKAPAGTFKGTALRSLQGHIYSAFLGIPYALPPIGDLRFAKPKPYPKIDYIYKATKYAPICIQPTGVELGILAQEDCLYLNVYIPDQENENILEYAELKKVLVYIHGGGYFMGSSFEYKPGDLVAMGDVIVVTFNYRLSWLGFLKGNTTELPGNQGIWDQILALKWVKNNIKAFRGDPDDITLAGNSMGGESVSALSISPHGKGLFTKGVIMSGTMFTCPSTPGSSDILLHLLTDRVGCKHETIEQSVTCLRELPAEKFVLPVEGRITNKFTTIDGDLFPQPIQKLIKNENYLWEIGFFSRNYIVSLTNNEGAIEFFGPFDTGVDPDDLSARFISQAFQIPLAVSEKILSWYNMPGHFRFKPAYDLIADYTMTMPTYRFLQVFASENRKNSKAYFLYFDYLPSYLPSKLQGSGHGFDLMYLFDFQPDEILQYYYHLRATGTFTDQDFRIKRRYIDIITDFMRSGDPGRTLREEFFVQWPEFSVISEGYLVFGRSLTVQNFPLKDRIKFWVRLYPEYLNEYIKQHSRLEL